jgi:cell division protein FtsW
VYSGIGVVLLVMSASLDISVTKKLLPIIVIATLILCLTVFFPGIGSERNGARRWIRLPFNTTLQPSEFAKIAVILFLSNYFSKESFSRLTSDLTQQSIAAKRPASIPILGLMVFVLVIFFQKDFSTATFILFLGAVLFFISGTSLISLIAFSVLAIPLTVLFVFTEPYRINRLIAFANPNFDIHGINFQTSASRTAISAGGLFGEGIGVGLSRINRIPEVQADYIFAGWTEAMGFAGVLIFLALIAFFAWRGFSIAIHCKNNFGSLCAFGCVSSIVLQSLVNCGVVSNALPPTGLPLPFFSSGGSNLISTFCMCGVLLQVSRIKPLELGQDDA